MTSSRRSCSKSTSMSGGSRRSSETKRSKSRPERTGSIEVMPSTKQADGISTGVLNFEPLQDKWEAFGWHVQRVDGNDISALVQAFDAARGLAEPKPCVIICDTKMA